MNDADFRILKHLLEKVVRIEAMLMQLTAPKKKRKARVSQTKYPVEFEDAWGEFPKRVGSNPKKKALSAWFARVDESTFFPGVSELEENATKFRILCGVVAYCQFCDATVEDKKYVMQAATFFGPEKHYLNDWSLPKVKPSEDPDKRHVPIYDHKAPVKITPGIDPYKETAR